MDKVEWLRDSFARRKTLARPALLSALYFVIRQMYDVCCDGCAAVVSRTWRNTSLVWPMIHHTCACSSYMKQPRYPCNLKKKRKKIVRIPERYLFQVEFDRDLLDRLGEFSEIPYAYVVQGRLIGPVLRDKRLHARTLGASYAHANQVAYSAWSHKPSRYESRESSYKF